MFMATGIAPRSSTIGKAAMMITMNSSEIPEAISSSSMLIESHHHWLLPAIISLTIVCQMAFVYNSFFGGVVDEGEVG